MNLSDYLSSYRKQGVLLAKRLGISPAYLSQLKTGVRTPSEILAIKIEQETKGAVRCEDIRPDVNWSYLRGTCNEQFLNNSHSINKEAQQ